MSRLRGVRGMRRKDGTMVLLGQLAGNQCLVAPVTAWVISQLLKFILTALVTGRFTRERLWGSGGMPSAHAATVSALTVSIGLTQGVTGGDFALSAIFAIVVMYDACGVRLEAGRHARRLNELTEQLRSPETKTPEEKPFHEQVGHTIPQVLAGAVLGALIAVLFYTQLS